MASKMFNPSAAAKASGAAASAITMTYYLSQIPRNSPSGSLEMFASSLIQRSQPVSTTACRQLTSQIIKPAKTQIITPNMTLKYSASIPLATQFKSPQRSVSESHYSQEEEEARLAAASATGATAGGVQKAKRPLAVVMAWLMAGEKQLEKYRQLYLHRGFDVLTVRTSPIQFIYPKNGSQKIAENMIQFLAKATENYPKVVVHTFSVGTYQFGEVLVKLKSNSSSPITQRIGNSIKGLILDSTVDVTHAPPAVGRAVSPKSKFGQKSIEFALSGYLRLAEKMATRHYRASQDTVHENPFKTPSLIIVSHKDKFATVEANEILTQAHANAGIPTQFKVFTESPHVQHYRYYPTEYEQLIEKFLTTFVNPINPTAN